MKLNIKQFEIKTAQEFEQEMIKLSKNNDGVFTASVVFGIVFVKSFNFPSQIRSAQIDGSPVNFKGFWENGNFVSFTQDFINKKNKANNKKIVLGKTPSGG